MAQPRDHDLQRVEGLISAEVHEHHRTVHRVADDLVGDLLGGRPALGYRHPVDGVDVPQQRLGVAHAGCRVEHGLVVAPVRGSPVRNGILAGAGLQDGGGVGQLLADEGSRRGTSGTRRGGWRSLATAGEIAVMHGVVADLEELRVCLDDCQHLLTDGGLAHGPGREDRGAHPVGDEEVHDVQRRIQAATHVEGERHLRTRSRNGPIDRAWRRRCAVSGVAGGDRRACGPSLH